MRLLLLNAQKAHLGQRAVAKRKLANVPYACRDGHRFEPGLFKTLVANDFQALAQQHLFECPARAKGLRVNGHQTARCAEVRVL